MDTTTATKRRNLPPVPRSSPERRPARDAEAPTASATARAEPGPLGPGRDEGQEFVARLRAAAADFAHAAGAQVAVVREAVPPARHRRSRCRLVLRYDDGRESDLTFLGPAGRSVTGFDRRIQEWLAEGQPREATWLVSDPDAVEGRAIDVAAWRPRS